MKRKINLIITILAGIFFVLLLVKDFFPDISIDRTILIYGLLACVLLSILTWPEKSEAEKASHLGKIASVSALFLLIFMLVLFGGESESGVGHPLMWLIGLGVIIVAVSNWIADRK
ncbi:hypothetical protein [Lentibacillus sediminis]|uniref:hypothetical protein n=1 Tax=Lentibacillus sediminis TaxID=1940529 RepID=UPI000C1BDC20|nr:hypothetical protein [Lentibacillus sediminis]